MQKSFIHNGCIHNISPGKMIIELVWNLRKEKVEFSLIKFSGTKNMEFWQFCHTPIFNKCFKIFALVVVFICNEGYRMIEVAIKVRDDEQILTQKFLLFSEGLKISHDDVDLSKMVQDTISKFKGQATDIVVKIKYTW